MTIDDFCYNVNRYFRKIRASSFRPLLAILHKARITANQLTNVRLLLAIAFILLFNYHRIASIALITISLLLDMVDGALARYQKRASDRGKFLDICTDNAIYSLIVMTFLYFGVDSLLVAAHLVLIPYAYLLAVIKKNEHKKSDWIIRPAARIGYLKILPGAAFYGFFLFRVDYLELSLYVASVLCAISIAHHYITIQLRWKTQP